MTRATSSDIFISQSDKYITIYFRRYTTMKQNKKLLAVLGAALCILFNAWAIWDSLAHHGGRLVYPMDSYAHCPGF